MVFRLMVLALSAPSLAGQLSYDRVQAQTAIPTSIQIEKPDANGDVPGYGALEIDNLSIAIDLAGERAEVSVQARISNHADREISSTITRLLPEGVQIRSPRAATKHEEKTYDGLLPCPAGLSTSAEISLPAKGSCSNRFSYSAIYSADQGLAFSLGNLPARSWVTIAVTVRCMAAPPQIVSPAGYQVELDKTIDGWSMVLADGMQRMDEKARKTPLLLIGGTLPDSGFGTCPRSNLP